MNAERRPARGGALDGGEHVSTIVAPATDTALDRRALDSERAVARAIRLGNVAVTEAIFRLSLLAGHELGVVDWMSTYAPADCIHPLDPAVIREAVLVAHVGGWSS